MSDDYSNYKKLLIFGSSRVGKTSLADLFESNESNKFENTGSKGKL
jgi:GTPase SAR1 family protein